MYGSMVAFTKHSRGVCCFLTISQEEVLYNPGLQQLCCLCGGTRLWHTRMWHLTGTRGSRYRKQEGADLIAIQCGGWEGGGGGRGEEGGGTSASSRYRTQEGADLNAFNDMLLSMAQVGKPVRPFLKSHVKGCGQFSAAEPSASGYRLFNSSQAFLKPTGSE